MSFRTSLDELQSSKVTQTVFNNLNRSDINDSGFWLAITYASTVFFRFNLIGDCNNNETIFAGYFNGTVTDKYSTFQFNVRITPYLIP